MGADVTSVAALDRVRDADGSLLHLVDGSTQPATHIPHALDMVVPAQLHQTESAVWLPLLCTSTCSERGGGCSRATVAQPPAPKKQRCGYAACDPSAAGVWAL